MSAKTCLQTAALALPLLAAGTMAHAEPIAGERLRAFVEGKRIYLATPFGLELPLRYLPDGTVSGDITGFSFARMFSPREDGRWWVAGDRLCQKWASWYAGKTSCFTVRKTGEQSIIWTRDDGASGRARVAG